MRHDHLLPNARKLGRIDGRNVFRFAVGVEQVNTLSRDFRAQMTVITVLSHSATDACNSVRDEMLDNGVDAPTTITTFGMRGGRTERFMGWETIFSEMMWRNRDTQLKMEGI